jgi:DNA polymerase-3 subunit epsilon
MANICPFRTFVRYTESVASASPLAALEPIRIDDLDREGAPADLATSLSEVTFVVLDLETTGGSPAADRITEIGALKLRGGELLSRLETFVNPGVPLPPFITLLTGITEAMVAPAPEIEELLPTLLEFVRGAVIVGHNIRFDCAFLDAALRRNGYHRLTNRRVDTIGLARRLVREDVPNLRLHTLATHFRTDTEPVHRAYADAAATGEVFHSLLEHAGTFGVFGLDDLLALPKVRVHRSTAKLALTGSLPRAHGVYVFRDRAGDVLYVGKATNLRAQVRAYFAGDERPTVPQLLREATRIDHRVCAGPLETAVRAQRLVRTWHPRFNRRSGRRSRPGYLVLTRTRRARLTLARAGSPTDNDVLGPFRSTAAARVVQRAFVPPSDATRLLDALAGRVGELAGTGGSRAELGALVDALRVRQTIRAWLDATRLVFDTSEGRVEVRAGRARFASDTDADAPGAGDLDACVEELLLVARWISRNARRVRLVYAEGEWASELPAVPAADVGRSEPGTL